jgi:hypothetical protein
MGLLVLQELLTSLMIQADDVLFAPSSSLRIFSGLVYQEFWSRESSSSSTTQKSILHHEDLKFATAGLDCVH